MNPAQLVAAITAAGVAFQAERASLMTRIVVKVEANAKRVTPVRTGNLRRSLTHRVMSAGEVGVVGTNVHYARYVHDGARGRAGRPFLRQGLEATRPEIDGMLRDSGERIVRIMAGGG